MQAVLAGVGGTSSRGEGGRVLVERKQRRSLARSPPRCGLAWVHFEQSCSSAGQPLVCTVVKQAQREELNSSSDAPRRNLPSP